MHSRNHPTIRGVHDAIVDGQRVFRVDDPNALTQLVGWLKFTTESSAVVYRGQSSMYSAMKPSAERAPHDPEQFSRDMREYIDLLAGRSCKCVGGPFKFGKSHLCVEQVGDARRLRPALVSSTYRAVVEPLLQHYGIRSRWVDVVDNIWVALWFAVYRQETLGRHAHHHLRSTAVEGSDANAFIAVFDTGMLAPTAIPGYSLSDEVRLVDLRYCVPSIYLRPHAQHGMLIARRRLDPTLGGALTDSVAAYIQIPLQNAIDWLGSGAMLSSFVIFPPATRDEGYRKFLDRAPEPPSRLGQLTLFGPSA